MTENKQKAGTSGVIIVRGAGDLATGVIVRLRRSGYAVAALETGRPTAIRRTVSMSECVYDGSITVEGIRAVLVHGEEELLAAISPTTVPVLVDPDGTSLPTIRPAAVVDAIIAKKNMGTHMGMAPVVIALGPGFVAGVDAHAVVETVRGHDLGRVILEGPAAADTRTPGIIAGYGVERVVRSPIAGIVEPLRELGDLVEIGEPILRVVDGNDGATVVSPLPGKIRGMIRPGMPVTPGFKIADVDPRGAKVDEKTISDKGRAIAGGVLEALLMSGIVP